MCAILRTGFFLTQILNFFKLLVKTHTPTSVVDKLLHHINVIKKNQLCNTVTNTVKHTLSIIILLLFSLDLTQKTITKTNKNEKKFFSNYVYYSPTIEL